MRRPASEPTSDPRLTGKILLVDDEPLLLRAISRVLSHAGHEVDHAANCEEALSLVSKRQFDGAFVDLGLPDRGGLELLGQLHARDPDLPVVLMTGMPTLQTAIDAVAAGALRYLVKPVEPPALQQAASEVVSTRRRTEAGRRDHASEEKERQEKLLDAALARLYMVYQPIVRFSTRQVYSYEALMRTQEKELQSPNAFIDAAHRANRLSDLGRRIRRTVAAAMAPMESTLFVNLHPVDLLDEDLLDPEAPLSQVAGRVVLEVTERAGLEAIGDLGVRLARLRALGFRIAIDDLGEGYAGLTSLARVEPEFVKLDMSLVRGLDHGPPVQRHIVRLTVQLCRILGAEVVAEGVETEAERDALLELGCDLLQGYLFARPAPEFVVPKIG